MSKTGLSDIVDEVPQSLLEQTPLLLPPPGVESNFKNPTSEGPNTIVVGSVFLAVALCFFLLRIYAKLRVVKKLAFDDMICLLGLLISVVHYAGIVIGCWKGAVGRHGWDIPASLALGRPNTMSIYIVAVTAPLALGIVKVTLLVQYYTFFWPFRWVRVCAWVGATVCAVTYGAITVAMLILETPRHRQSWAQNQVAEHTLDAAKLAVPMGIVGVAIDIILLILPIRAVSKLQLPIKRKIGLILIFLTGISALVASIAGLYYRVVDTDPFGDIEWAVAHVWLWSMVEMFLGVVCASMPSFSRLMSHHAPAFTNLSAYLTPRRVLTPVGHGNHDTNEDGTITNTPSTAESTIQITREISVFSEPLAQ